MAQIQIDPTSAAASAPDPTVDHAPESTPPSNVHDLPHPVPTLTNSPQCVPARPVVDRSAPALPPAQPTQPARPRVLRRARVDAWAVPASTNWTRMRKSARKVNRTGRASDWALPF